MTESRWIRGGPGGGACSRAHGAALTLALTLAHVGCREAEVGVQLLFPSEETFLRTNTISVDVFDGEGSGDQGADAICRALSVETSVAPTGVQALASAPATEACFVQEGGVRFEQVPVGRRVFFAEAVAADATPLLRGCTVADVYAAEDGDAQAATVEVQMATLPGYPDGTALLCESITAKCEERRPCVE